MFKHSLALEDVRLRINLPSQVRDGLHLVDTVEQVADHFDDLLLLTNEGHTLLEHFKGLDDLLVVRYGALVFVLVDAEQGFRVLG